MDDKPAGPTTPLLEPMAIVALVAGAMAYPSSCCFSCFSLGFDFIAILIGVLAYQKIVDNPEQLRGKELAITGIVLGALHALMVLATVFLYMCIFLATVIKESL